MIGRREFLCDAIGIPPLAAALFSAAVTAACKDSGSGKNQSAEDSALSTCTTNGDACDTSGVVATSISANHGHTVDLTGLDEANPADVTLSLTPSSTVPSHTHNVTLTAAMVTDIGGQFILRVVTDPDTTGHSHCVNFNCNLESSSGGGGGGYY